MYGKFGYFTVVENFIGSGVCAVMFWPQELILNSSGVGLNFWVNFDSWNQNIGAK